MIDHNAGSKDWILGRPAPEPTRVPTPEWGEGSSVLVGPLSSEDKDDFDNWFQNADPPIGAACRLAAMGLRNEDGSRQKWEEHEIEQLGAKHGGVVERIAQAVKELTYVTEEDVQEQEKN